MMHARNRYRNTPPNFAALAIKYPQLRRFCSITTAGKVNIDFKSEEAVCVLTQLLLLEDFGIQIEIPHGYLVPRVPQRLDYILVLEDILRLNRINENIIGLDIGTGPICIYPFLAVAQNPTWKMYATEIDPTSIRHARVNLENNQKTEQIIVFETTVDNFFEKVLTKQITFSMCNPPFFDKSELEDKFTQLTPSTQTYTNAASDCNESARSRTLAQARELSVDGGEVEFVKQMIAESQNYKTLVQIYSTLLGKKSSVTILEKHLKRLNISNHVWIIGQGRTYRWILAWTYDSKIKFV